MFACVSASFLRALVRSILHPYVWRSTTSSTRSSVSFKRGIIVSTRRTGTGCQEARFSRLLTCLLTPCDFSRAGTYLNLLGSLSLRRRGPHYSSQPPCAPLKASWAFSEAFKGVFLPSVFQSFTGIAPCLPSALLVLRLRVYFPCQPLLRDLRILRRSIHAEVTPP